MGMGPTQTAGMIGLFATLCPFLFCLVYLCLPCSLTRSTSRSHLRTAHSTPLKRKPGIIVMPGYNRKRKVILVLLAVFVAAQAPFYAGMWIHSQLTQHLYSLHILAIWALCVAFLAFSTLWVDELAIFATTRRAANWCAVALSVVHTALMIIAVFSNQKGNWVENEQGQESLFYLLWFVLSEFLSCTVCLGFLLYTCRLAGRVCLITGALAPMKLHIGRKLMAVVGMCLLCFLPRLFLDVVLFYQRKYGWAKWFTDMNFVSWVVIYLLIPDTGLWCIMSCLTVVRSDRNNPSHGGRTGLLDTGRDREEITHTGSAPGDIIEDTSSAHPLMRVPSQEGDVLLHEDEVDPLPHHHHHHQHHHHQQQLEGNEEGGTDDDDDDDEDEEVEKEGVEGVGNRKRGDNHNNNHNYNNNHDHHSPTNTKPNTTYGTLSLSSYQSIHE